MKDYISNLLIRINKFILHVNRTKIIMSNLRKNFFYKIRSYTRLKQSLRSIHRIYESDNNTICSHRTCFIKDIRFSFFIIKVKTHMGKSQCIQTFFFVFAEKTPKYHR